tara:strand:+ start:418 stop:597 length:180 start_codon:yes stop_codon:yes gene_type:complete
MLVLITIRKLRTLMVGARVPLETVEEISREIKEDFHLIHSDLNRRAIERELVQPKGFES